MEELYETGSGNQTMALGKKIAKTLHAGDVIRLEGDLGAGKTTFVKGVALGLGIKKAASVKSPTFVILHIYPTRIPLYHFDLYRLEEMKDFDAIGLDDFVSDPSAIKCVEWAEKAANLFPENSITVRFKIRGENQRTIRVFRGGTKRKISRRKKRHEIRKENDS